TKRAARDWSFRGEPPQLTRTKGGQPPSDRIVGAENGDVRGGLVTQQVELAVAVVLERRVPVEVVWGHVEDSAHARSLAQTFELVAAELEDDPRVRRNVIDVLDQRRSD